MISEGYKHNFGLLRRAFDNAQAALVECRDAKTGEPIMAVCAVRLIESKFVMTPLAKMFDGNPYEEVLPPEIPWESCG